MTAIFELLPFSYDEVRHLAEKKSLDELLLDDFYPAIYAEKNKATYIYPNYVKTYIERDVRDLLAIKDLMQFQTFIRLCAGRIGSLFNASALANEVDLLLSSGSNFKAIEIKSSQTFHPDFTKGIKAFSREYGDKVIEKSIIYAGDRELVGDTKLLNYSKMDTILATTTQTAQPLCNLFDILHND